MSITDKQRSTYLHELQAIRARQVEAVSKGLFDFEDDHVRADEVLCEILNLLGFGDVVEAWEEIAKGYN